MIPDATCDVSVSSGGVDRLSSSPVVASRYGVEWYRTYIPGDGDIIPIMRIDVFLSYDTAVHPRR